MKIDVAEQVFLGHEAVVHCVRFSPDGRTILSSSGGRLDPENSVGDCTVRLWEASTGREIRQFTGHTDMVFACGFSPDGRYAVSGSRDRSIRVWDVATGRELCRYTAHGRTLQSAVFSPDGRSVVSAGYGHKIHLWKLRCIRFRGQSDCLIQGCPETVRLAASVPFQGIAPAAVARARLVFRLFFQFSARDLRWFFASARWAASNSSGVI